jgi:hypothetical protein
VVVDRLLVSARHKQQGAVYGCRLGAGHGRVYEIAESIRDFGSEPPCKGRRDGAAVDDCRSGLQFLQNAVRAEVYLFNCLVIADHRDDHVNSLGYFERR